MRAVSLFSGVGGFEIGFARAGIDTVLQAEQDPWCLSVLARHWPHTARVNDVRQVDATALAGGSGDVARAEHRADAEPERHAHGPGGAAAAVDLIYGGFPCQDLSVAGKRAGLGGARSGLWSEFARVVRELWPTWVCAENVPGLLSSADGRDFGQILSDLDDLGYGVAWAVLDARHFGVPQRRRRLFIVGCLGDPDAAAAVLAVCEGGCRHPAPRREAGQGAAADAADRIAFTLPATYRGIGNGWNSNHVASTLSGGGHSPGVNMPGRRKEDDVNLVVSAITSKWSTGSGGPSGDEAQNLIVANTVRASDGHHGHSSPRGDGGDNLVAFSRTQSWSSGDGADISPPTRSAGHGASNNPAIAYAAGVRRLTPLECERLMGWPDDWTRYGADGHELADAHRYRLCGNGVVAPVAEWLGHRLMAVDAARQSGAEQLASAKFKTSVGSAPDSRAALHLRERTAST